MKNLLFLSLFLFSSLVLASENEEKQVFPSYCSNYTYGNTPVSFSFSSCVNNNFNSFGRELDNSLYLSYCSNFGNTVQYSYVNCINNNFQKLSRHLNISYMPYCNNYSNNELDFSFLSCVNRNNDEIAWTLNRQDD